MNESFVTSALSAFWVIFFSELGDRTFLATFLFSSTIEQSNDHTLLQSILSRESFVLLLATNAAAALLAAISAGLGSLSSHLIDPSINQSIHVIVSLICVLFGCHMIYEAATEDDSHASTATQETVNPTNSTIIKSTTNQSLYILFLQAFTASILTESFDHGQLSFFMLSTNKSTNQAGLLIGGISAHVLCTFVAAVGGRGFTLINHTTNQSNARRIQRWIRYGAGAVFVSMALNQIFAAH